MSHVSKVSENLTVAKLKYTQPVLIQSAASLFENGSQCVLPGVTAKVSGKTRCCDFQYLVGRRKVDVTKPGSTKLNYLKF